MQMPVRRSKGTDLKKPAFVLLCLAGIGASALTLGPALRFTANGITDFMPLHAGGKLAFSDHLYDSARVLETERQTEGWSSPARLYIRLPFEALLFRPLALLNYKLASAIWEIVNAGALAAFAMLWPHRRRRAWWFWLVAGPCQP